MSCLVVCPPSKTDNFCGFLGFAFVMFHLHSSCYLLLFYNIPHLPPWISDLLCTPHNRIDKTERISFYVFILYLPWSWWNYFVNAPFGNYISVLSWLFFVEINLLSVLRGSWFATQNPICPILIVTHYLSLCGSINNLRRNSQTANWPSHAPAPHCPAHFTLLFSISSSPHNVNVSFVPAADPVRRDCGKRNVLIITFCHKDDICLEQSVKMILCNKWLTIQNWRFHPISSVLTWHETVWQILSKKLHVLLIAAIKPCLSPPNKRPANGKIKWWFIKTNC